MTTINTVVLSGGKVPASVSQVASVAGKTGTVSLVKADVGLGNVDNTTDAGKPISTATQTALNGKAAAVHTHAAADLTATGTKDATTFLRGDNTWAVPAGGGTPADGSISTAKLADTAVTKAKLASAVQTSIDKADAAAPVASPTFTGVATAPAVKVTGGNPLSGKVLAATDILGNCAWADGPNVELAYAGISASSTLATTATAIPGLAITFATGARPVMLEAYTGGFYCDGTATVTYQIRNGAGTILATGVSNHTAAQGFGFSTALRFRLAAGLASDTYTVFAWVSAGSASTKKINPAPDFSMAGIAYIQAISV